ncbi:hypothetical protein OG883_09910 [Streptomyces sp. NBC_01142]|uniref:hypothetical protein n=1 Tax=Streptomyces sp. NBC_01142 TaxID=2975865 RepID=UPI00225064B2|nr:hypothetical protein [Streptomyces sp. NBC_01142]MCX4820215.1 hypothetical protein [Streptomyces sp. NBC_01142]
MTETVLVHCPSCRRDHLYAPSVYPCACGAPLAPPLLRAAPPEPITHRTWTDDWVTVRCQACGRQDQWPQPELGCPCGTVLRIPVRPVSSPVPATPGSASTRPSQAPQPQSSPSPQSSQSPHSPHSPPGSQSASAGRPAHIPPPRTATAPRPSFRPVTIRTARDAVTAAALYLQWLGFRDIIRPEVRPSSGIDLRGPGLVAQVDPSTRPATLRDVECLWLNGLSTSAASVFFSLAGYANDARARADALGIPLFIMDLTGSPQPVNAPADELITTGA